MEGWVGWTIFTIGIIGAGLAWLAFVASPLLVLVIGALLGVAGWMMSTPDEEPPRR